MANGYTLRIDSIVSDGTNIYLSCTLNDGAHAFPPIMPVFEVGSTQAQINTYLQNVVNNGPTLAREINELAGKLYTGA